jgi:arylsulfatase A-like enzyme
MHTQNLIRVAIGLILAASFQSARAAAADKLVGARPNIVLVITDDQGYPPIGRHGHPWIQTPNLDKLYDASVRFTRFLVSPTCSPTRSAIMTGRHPMKNGVTHTILERERMTLDAVTLPQVLKSAGYATGAFGKWHLGDEDAYQPQRRGFDEAFIHGAGGIGQFYDCSCADAPGSKYFDPFVRHNGSFVKTKGFCTDVFFTAALGWVQSAKDRNEPFFAYVATNAPHAPFIAPEKNVKRFTDLGFTKQHAGFYGMVENIDQNMGRLLDKLAEWKLLDNTVVIFMSDNGMSEGTGRDVVGRTADGKPLEYYNAGMKGSKNTVDEGGVRVPFFLRWDGKVKPNREVDRIAAHIDILPTLATIAGAKLPANQVEGRNLLPLIESEEAAKDWNDRFLFTHQGRWPKGDDPDKWQWKNFAVRNQRFRFVNGTDLFDMQADPGQTKNVIGAHPDVVKEMRAAYDAWWKETRPMMVNEAAPLSKTRPYWEAYHAQEKAKGIPRWVSPKL